jgi:short-subunit dehydrogenase
MIEVNLMAPILLTRLALPLLMQSGDGTLVNVSSGLGLIGTPFYATYGATKAGLALFGEALRREVSGHGVHVLTVYPTATDTPMMSSSRSTAPRDSAGEVADAIIEAIRVRALEVVRGGSARAQMIEQNRSAPAEVDKHFVALRPTLEEAVQDHSAL